MVPVSLMTSAMRKTTGAMVVIRQQALSVQMIDQGDGSLRIVSLSDKSPLNLNHGRAVDCTRRKRLTRNTFQA